MNKLIELFNNRRRFQRHKFVKILANKLTYMDLNIKTKEICKSNKK